MASRSPVSAPAAASAFRPEAPPESYVIQSGSGEKRTAGAGPPTFVVQIPTLSQWDRLTGRGAYAVATAFVEGQFDIKGDLVAAIRWWRAFHHPKHTWTMKALSHLRLERWFQSRTRARNNIRFHYDRSNLFYRQFLDSRMIYSSAYFASPSDPLDQAQLAKLDRICGKLDVRPGERFLDVGCGWGALVVCAAERYGAIAFGCTLSAAQMELATETIRARQLTRRIRVENRDYRSLTGRYDKVASVGMYEHVGCRRLEQYFTTLSGLLAPNGLLLNAGIARPQAVTDDGETVFLQRRVFPGGELPHLADVIRAAERAALEVLDVENLRLHYALTCAAWVRRLQAHREQCLALVDSVTYRTWLLYLAAAAVSFERGETDLYEILLAKRGADSERRLRRD